VKRWIIDASLTLGWYLKDEENRSYNLEILEGLKDNEAIAPWLWAYEVTNGLVMAHRRKRISDEVLAEILENLGSLQVLLEPPDLKRVLALPSLATQYQLTVYDAAYLEMGIRLKVPIATKDSAMLRAMAACGVSVAKPRR